MLWLRLEAKPKQILGFMDRGNFHEIRNKQKIPRHLVEERGCASGGVERVCGRISWIEIGTCAPTKFKEHRANCADCIVTPSADNLLTVGKSKPAWQAQDDLFLVPSGGWILAALLLLSVALAGGRPLWAQGVVTIGIGLLWLRWPPRSAPRRELMWALIALAAAPLAAYLPKFLFPSPLWRQELASLPAIHSSFFITLQPWFTFHIWLLWLSGVALAAWCCAQTWDHYNRSTLARMYTGGIVAITVFAIYGFSTGNNPSFWQSTEGFGPFLNRNQWGATMGMAGIMAVALIHQAVRRQRKRRVFFWSASLALLIGAVILNGSRGGLLILVAGGGAYWMFYGLIRRQYQYAAVGVSFVLISFAIFSLGGSVLLERFVSIQQTIQTGGEEDFRLQFYRMIKPLFADAPLTGFGLGNFEFIFPFYLDYAPVFDRRPIHPENSFLWLLSEGGLLLVLAVAAVVIVLLRLAYTARRSRAATMRAAGLACVLMLIFSSFFEVNGHRIGTLFPVIFLGSLALPIADGTPFSPRTLRLLRVFGGGIVLVGFLWLTASSGLFLFPRIQGISPLHAAAARAHGAGDLERAIALLKSSTRLKPLDWASHWTLGTYLLEKNSPDLAWNEFRAAGAFLPYSDWMLEEEGHLWLTINPMRAAFVWSEALQRTPHANRSSMYIGMLKASEKNPSLRAMLLRLFPNDPELEFIRIKEPGDVGMARLNGLLTKTQDLEYAPDYLVEPVLRYMLEHGQSARLDAIVDNHKRVKQIGWRVLVSRAVNEGHFEDAVRLYFQYGTQPILPSQITGGDFQAIERAATLTPDNITAAIAYYQMLEGARRKDEALWQLRRIMEFSTAPTYIWYLAAKAEYDRKNYEEAWKLLRTYEEKTRP